jgi:hypothetical protein
MLEFMLRMESADFGKLPKHEQDALVEEYKFWKIP